MAIGDAVKKVADKVSGMFSNTDTVPVGNQIPNGEAIARQGAEILQKYKEGKSALESRIIENERWYLSQHWDFIRQKSASKDDPEPTTAFLFSTLANKHADAMDNYPEANTLAREEGDKAESQKLDGVVPFVLDNNGFYLTYDRAWWYKLKHGFCIYGTFWNERLENGLGDIAIKYIDALNVFWEPGCTDIQDSRNVFVTALVDNDILYEVYPQTKGKITGEKTVEIKQYMFDGSVDTTNKSLVVDWYFRKQVGNKTVVHLRKFVGGILLESTEEGELANEGLYEHGMYPIDFDVLFPIEGTCYGFGFIDIVKNPQIYADKLDQIISKNALQSGKKRWFYKESAGIDMEKFADWGNELIPCTGSPNEDNLREFQVSPIAAFIPEHRQIKINELKEVAGNRDFQQGGTNGGVTAYGAIAALQEAGNKLSRDMISATYNIAYTNIIYKVIALIGQFYDNERSIRITGADGEAQYLKYSNSGLKPQVLPPTYMGEEPKYRKPVFDIKVKPQKASPFSRALFNQMAQDMFNVGFFNPARAAEAKIALEMMTFEGKEKIVQQVAQNGDLFLQLQQAQQTILQLNQHMAKMTGKDLSIPLGGGAGG